MTKKELQEIRMRFSDGSSTIIQKHQLDEITELIEALSMLERAKNIYSELKIVFEKENGEG